MPDRIPKNDSVCHLVVEQVALRFPFWRYYSMLRNQPPTFLLDSAMDANGLGRFSFMGGDPFLVFRARRRPSATEHMLAEIEIEHRRAPGGAAIDPPRVERYVAEPFQELRRLCREHRPAEEPSLDDPIPFLAGAVGYFSYESGGFIESLPSVAQDDLGLPDICFLFVETVLSHSHQSGRSYLSVLGRGADPPAAEEHAQMIAADYRQRIHEWEHRSPADDPDCSVGAPDNSGPLDVSARFDEADYCRLVERIGEHIAAGDVYQACLSQRLETPFMGDPWQLYRELRRINPAPFASLIELPEVAVVSASPERFLKLDRDRMAESRPIKGTRPRGDTPQRDAALRRELAASPKDRAENVMIVDLVRNDLGRVCEVGSVRVSDLMSIEDYATVFQLVSTIRGRLRDGLDGLDLLRACFPGGSMTGAPKIEAMRIIDRLEPVCRGIYSGAIGYLDHSGAMDLSMVIRTIILKAGRAFVHTGGAIVADSNPADEYAETMHKAAALIQALTNVQQISSRPPPVAHTV